MPGISEALSRVFSKYDLRVAHMPVSKLRNQLMNVKDRLPNEQFPGVVYKIPCLNCNHAYIGETGKFSRRIKDHQRDVKNKKHATNALAGHAHDTGHQIDWGNASILSKERNLTTRLLLESLFIQTSQATLNKNAGPMPGIYARSLRHILRI